MGVLKYKDSTTGQWQDIPALIGPTGSSGVYYGATEPTDSDIDVWINPNGAADPILPEEGTNYIKFPNGTLMCWGNVPDMDGATTAYGNLYYRTFSVNIVFPVAFSSKPFVSIYGGADTWQMQNKSEWDTTHISTIEIVRPNSGTIYLQGAVWFAIGRWK